MTNKCTNCNVNCDGCTGSGLCYNCQTGAALINNTCVFSLCTSPCATCEGKGANCLSCIVSSSVTYYFYQN